MQIIASHSTHNSIAYANGHWNSHNETGEPADFRVAKELRNQAKAMVRRAKASYIQEESDKHTKDPKRF